MRILLLEDHTEMREAIARRLRALGNSVDETSTLAEAKSYPEAAAYDVIVLDRMLPDGDAITLLHALRNANNQAPVLLLTARDQIDDRVAGLEAGADDYLVKPFAMDELVARINTLARRKTPPRLSVLECADLEVNTSKREVRRAGVLVPLRPKEYALLELLITRMGRAVSREAILEYCWDVLESPASNVEESLIASLRRKLGQPVLIKTVRGLGYMLEAPSE